MATRSKARTTRAAKSKPAASRKRKAAPASAETTDPFRHIIVLMLENRSFDHALGALQAVIPVEGVPPAGPPRTNLDINGVPVAQLPDAIDVVRPDPKHECKDVLEQLREDNGRFVKNFQNAHPDAAPEPVMTYHKLDSLPALHKLAREFAVFDKWFSSVPGPTWTNRLFAMSGTSRGRVLMPQSVFHPHLHKYDQPSVFRRLEEAKRTHRIYRGDFPLALLLEDRRNLEAARNISTFADFLADADGSESAFPEFAFIEPRYLVNANDDHPPHPMGAGERLVSEVYEKLRANTELWESALLVVTFDEHGGFYDHCSPDDTVPPDNRHDEYTFDRLGVRVPTIFVSPWLKQQVIGAHCDHTSLLRSLRDRWGLGDMGERVAQAVDAIKQLKLESAPRVDTPSALAAPKPMAAARAISREAEKSRLNDNQAAIVAFSAYLDLETPEAPLRKVRAMKQATVSPTDAMQVAEERVERYLAYKRKPAAARRKPRTPR